MKSLNLRITLITLLLSLFFYARAIFFLLFTWGLIPDIYPASVNPMFWDAVLHIFFELGPTLILVLIINSEGNKKDVFDQYY